MTIHQRPPAVPRPRFYVWRRDILYLAAGKSRPGPHRVAHDKLVVAVEGRLRIKEGTQWRDTRSCLLLTGQWQHPDLIDVSEATTATWLLPPLSQCCPAMASIMTEVTPTVFMDHPSEQDLIAGFYHAAMDASPSAAAIRRKLSPLLIPTDLRDRMFREIDPRVIEVVRHIQQTATFNLPVASFAEKAGLSRSYLEKLFKAQTGLPITRYRLRYRIYLAAILLGMGYSITDAALRAGFASSSHFSRTYRALTGETASQMLLKSGAEILMEHRVLRLILPLVRGAGDSDEEEERVVGTTAIAG